MSYASAIWPNLEGIVSQQSGTSQRVAMWVELCKAVMRSDVLKSKDDWAFTSSTDVDQTGNDVETGARLYGLLVATNSADAETDFIVADDDSDGTVTLDGTAALVNTVQFAYNIPAAATDGVEEFHPFVFPEGLPFTDHMVFAADGRDGTDPATDDIRVWALYRTAVAE